MNVKEFIALKRAQITSFEKYARTINICSGRNEASQLHAQDNSVTLSSEMNMEDWEEQFNRFSESELIN